MKFKSPVYSEASGSIAGIVYSHNKGGLYTRARSVPTNPNSPRQQAVRTAMGNVLSRWTDDLSAAQRTAWETYAANTPVLDRLGELRTLSGQQQFLRSNIMREVAGISIVDDAPTVYDTGTPPAFAGSEQFTINASVFDSTVRFGGGASEDGHCLCFIGASQPASRSFFKGPYQWAAIVTFAQGAGSVDFATDTTSADWHADHVPADGERVPVRLVAAYVDGRYSQAYQEIKVAAVA